MTTTYDLTAIALAALNKAPAPEKVARQEPPAPKPPAPKKVQPVEAGDPVTGDGRFAFTIDVKTLYDTLRSFGGRSSLPILGGVRFDTLTNGVRVTMTDLETTVWRNIPHNGPVAGGGTVILDRKQLAGILTGVKKGTAATFTVDGPVTQISGYGSLISVGSENEWPKIDTPATRDTVNIDDPDGRIGAAFKRTLPACSSDQARPLLTVVAVESDEDNEMTLTGTDSYRLIHYQTGVPYEGSPDGNPALVPAATVKVAVKFGIEYMRVGRKHVVFGFDNGEVIGRRTEGTYPNYRVLLDKACDETYGAVYGPAASWIEAVKRCLPIAGDTLPVRVMYDMLGFPWLQVRKQERVQTGTKPVTRTVGGEKVETLEPVWEFVDQTAQGVIVEGGFDYEPDVEMVIAFNGRYLQEMIQAGDTTAAAGKRDGTVRLAIAGPLKPALISFDADPRYTGLLMPVRI